MLQSTSVPEAPNEPYRAGSVEDGQARFAGRRLLRQICSFGKELGRPNGLPRTVVRHSGAARPQG